MTTTNEQTTDPMRDGKPHVDAHRALRWSVTRAAKEFHVDFKTLTKRLTAAAISPGDDGRYSTLEIARALYLDGGDIDAEKLRKTKLECDLLQLRKDQAEHRLLDADKVLQVWSQAVLTVRGTILALPLPEAHRQEILDAITDIPLSDYVNTRGGGPIGNGTDTPSGTAIAIRTDAGPVATETRFAKNESG